MQICVYSSPLKYEMGILTVNVVPGRSPVNKISKVSSNNVYNSSNVVGYPWSSYMLSAVKRDIRHVITKGSYRPTSYITTPNGN